MLDTPEIVNVLTTEQRQLIQSRLQTQSLKGIESLEQRIVEHEGKLADYLKNPDKLDNKGFLKNASDELRKTIIESREKGLLREIDKFRNEVQKLKDTIVNYCSGGK